MNMNKMGQISVLGNIHIMLPFYLILTRRPKIIVKKNLRVILSSRMLCQVYVLLEFWQKIMAIPFMNPLLWFMIHCNKVAWLQRCQSRPLLRTCHDSDCMNVWAASLLVFNTKVIHYLPLENEIIGILLATVTYTIVITEFLINLSHTVKLCISYFLGLIIPQTLLESRQVIQLTYYLCLVSSLIISVAQPDHFFCSNLGGEKAFSPPKY